MDPLIIVFGFGVGIMRATLACVLLGAGLARSSSGVALPETA